ncbi:MAG: DUF1508 domain-containing protein, partial [Microbacterium sp.]|nr:DUF1508 domain-containing protein [Microbacterium sp.]
MDTLELYRDDAGDYRWRLTAANGRNLADSGEGYRRKRAALKGAAHALGLVVEHGSDALVIPGYTYPRRDGTSVH